jgi:ABC-type dipeptide/oligopeptide/nickel transport system permease component
MKRRTLLQSIAALFAVQPFARLRLSAQTPATSQLTPENIRTLRAIAEVVLPASIGAAGRDKAVSAFVTWIRNYKEGADMGHSYGASRLSAASGAAPAARYPAQFGALDKSAETIGAASFAGLPIDRRRPLIEAALNTPQPVTRMPARPTGANLIADLMLAVADPRISYD